MPVSILLLINIAMDWEMTEAVDLRSLGPCHLDLLLYMPIKGRPTSFYRIVSYCQSEKLRHIRQSLFYPKSALVSHRMTHQQHCG